MDRQAYIEKMHAQLKEWDAELVKLEAKLEKAGAEARSKYREKVKSARARRTEAEERLENMKQAGEDAWVELRAGVEHAYEVMKESIETARSKLK